MQPSSELLLEQSLIIARVNQFYQLDYEAYELAFFIYFDSVKTSSELLLEKSLFIPKAKSTVSDIWACES